MAGEFQIPTNNQILASSIARRFILISKGIQSARVDQYEAGEFQEDEPIGTSLLGTPVFSNLEIKAGQYRDLNNNLITFEGLRIDTILLTVSQEKNIVRTTVVGRNGTVKEYMSDADFSITADGIIIGETTQGSLQKEQGIGLDSAPILNKVSIGDKYPERDFERFIKIAQSPISLEVRSPYLDRFGITNIVIDGYEAPQSPGTSNIQAFNLRMSSDIPIELQ